MQETIQREQQEEHDKQKAEKRANEGADLLRANPNHVGRPEWDDDVEEEEDDEGDEGDAPGAVAPSGKNGVASDQANSDEERDDVEALVAGMAGTTL